MAWGGVEPRTVVSANGGLNGVGVRDGGEPNAPSRDGSTSHIDLAFHGLSISVAGDWPEVLEDVRADFAWFAADNGRATDIAIEVERTAPDFGIAGDIEASFVTPRNVVYQQDGRALIDYFGRAFSVYDRGEGRLLVQSQERDLVHEAVYRFILSRVGAHLETVGLTRLHALGLSGRDGAVAVLLPAGGGKSTLAITALRASAVKLLSEDSPLIDTKGRLYPFPLPLGVNDSEADRLPAGLTRTRTRMELGPKTVLELEAMIDRIESEPQPLRHLVIGRRTLGLEATLTPIPRRRLIRPLLRECVVGVGLYHGMEFVFQHSLRELIDMVGPACTRAGCSTAVLSRAQTWELRVGRDHEANWAALSPLLS